MTTSAIDSAHPEDHHGPLAHHFDNLEQQESSAKLGMWLFLGTELLMFSGLFLAYAVARTLYPEMMLVAHEFLSVPMGGLNTLVLITSSLTMALAVRSAQIGDMKRLERNLILTILFACTFMVVKYFEYTAKFHHGLLPGEAFYSHGGGPYPGGPQIFFGIYFLMTGLHGLHVLIGIGIIGWMLKRARRGDFSPEWYTPVENVGLYWHFVDIVWIFLFPLLYLVK